MNQFKIQNDALYETLRVACFSVRVRGLALSEAMPKALPLVHEVSPIGEEKALRCANKIQNLKTVSVGA
jgi:hypothetical protein